VFSVAAQPERAAKEEPMIRVVDWKHRSEGVAPAIPFSISALAMSGITGGLAESHGALRQTG
jgi:hypothetical protein